MDRDKKKVRFPGGESERNAGRDAHPQRSEKEITPLGQAWTSVKSRDPDCSHLRSCLRSC